MSNKEINTFIKIINYAKEGRWDLIEDMIDQQPELAIQKDDSNRTVLMELSHYAGSGGVVRKIIALGADVNYQSDDGLTAVANAITGGSKYGLSTLPELRILLENGADPNQRADAGYPALHWAIVMNKLEHAKLLLSFGADPNRLTIDLAPETAFDVAKRIPNKDALTMLENWRNTAKNT